MDDLHGKRVLVIGLGISGRSAAAFCTERGATVVACDDRMDAATAGLPPSVEVRLGQALPAVQDFDIVIPSPGVPAERYAGAQHAWGDIELASRALPVPIVAVTGTNGKSTTVRLTEAMLRAGGLRARAGGNVGDAALELVGEPLDVAVLEVSSFQLEATESFRPHVGVILGCTPDHLDRHGSLDAYRSVKLRLFAAQRSSDIAIVNADDADLRAATETLTAERWWVSTRGPVARGAFLDAGGIRICTPSHDVSLAHDDQTAFRGPLAVNLLSALLAALAIGVEPHKAYSAVADFRALPHRMETVSDRAGIRWIDDSKATNPGAAAASLGAMAGPVIWIAGGRGKGTGFAEIDDRALAFVRSVLTIGEAADEIEAAVAGRAPVEACRTLDVAVQRAAAIAVERDTVLLAPACASFDQFRSFEDRGDRFRQLVEAQR